VSRNGRRKYATLYDFRDLDLMLKIADLGGVVETQQLAEELGFGKDVWPVARRLSWMRRYGMLDFDEKLRQWDLSEGGLRVIKARVQASKIKTLEELPEEAMVEVMANVASRYHLGSPMVAAMLRREFLYGTRPR
jgi:hypothetical protein